MVDTLSEERAVVSILIISIPVVAVVKIGFEEDGKNVIG